MSVVLRNVRAEANKCDRETSSYVVGVSSDGGEFEDRVVGSPSVRVRRRTLKNWDGSY